jgi:hypothetical protein
VTTAALHRGANEGRLKADSFISFDVLRLFIVVIVCVMTMWVVEEVR